MNKEALVGSKVKIYVDRTVGTIQSFEMNESKKVVITVMLDKTGEIVELRQEDYNKTWGILNVVE